ncbi:MAG: hypothetical protein ACLPID_16065 [Beijerinckiaceae bacterium]
MKKTLLARGENWDVWTEWYEARLEGRPAIEALEVARVMIADDTWKQGPKVVNAEIKKLIARHTARAIPLETETAPLVVSPAPASLEIVRPVAEPVAQLSARGTSRQVTDSSSTVAPPRPWAESLTASINIPLGNIWTRSGDQLTIEPSGTESDVTAALDPPVKQLHEAIRRKANAFAATQTNIDERHGWEGFDSAFSRFTAAIDVDTAVIPGRIATVYDAIVELGSFLEQDNDLRSRTQGNVTPLDPTTRRALIDLIRTAAPWVRRFPTARAFDDDTGAFLLRKELWEPAHLAAKGAQSVGLISAEDRNLLEGLLSAIARNGLPAHKSGVRGIQSMKTLIVTAAYFVAGFYVNSISSDFANRSELVKRAGQFLVAKEEQVRKIVSDLPSDFQLALSSLLDELKRNPFK